KILYWCENCQCDKCLQQKKQYFDRKKNNVSFHAIEVIEEDAFGIESDDVICIESQFSCPFKELVVDEEEEEFNRIDLAAEFGDHNVHNHVIPFKTIEKENENLILLNSD
ncbi:hypothetical protein C6P40_005501, partial [Pichia californica]